MVRILSPYFSACYACGLGSLGRCGLAVVLRSGFCRHVIHHDLAWNPSDIEQRTGRVDRLGCKAEGRMSITVYLPYIEGAADERQFRVMSDRERWFRVVMGQDEVAKLITPETASVVSLPESIGDELGFDLSIPE